MREKARWSVISSLRKTARLEDCLDKYLCPWSSSSWATAAGSIPLIQCAKVAMTCGRKYRIHMKLYGGGKNAGWNKMFSRHREQKWKKKNNWNDTYTHTFLSWKSFHSHHHISSNKHTTRKCCTIDERESKMKFWNCIQICHANISYVPSCSKLYHSCNDD